MEKVTFKAKLDLPKIPKNATDPKVIEEARAKTKVKLTITGTFTPDESGVLELLLKSWQTVKKTNG